MDNKKSADRKENAKLRPPIIAVLGHVDHGKTTLLDFIRKSSLTRKEHGGITQKIGAYQTKLNDKKITFIDTPGHEAFAKIRLRGAKAADIALLVVAADDSVKPQTIESIKYIKEANIPVIVAINKMDLPTANPEKVKKDLSKYDILVEEFGGKIADVSISAKNGKGVSDLLETILLVAEMKKVTADENGEVEAVIIESVKDTRRGNVATAIVRNGTLKSGSDVFIFSTISQNASYEKLRVRAMFDENGQSVKEAEPGKPVEIIGFKKLPEVGSIISSSENLDMKLVKGEEIQEEKIQIKGEDLLKVVVKADSQGSLEAVLDGIAKDAEVISAGVGQIVEDDVRFAKTAKAFILGFNLKVSNRVAKLAEDEGVKIRTYDLIYKLFEELDDVVSFLKQGPEKEIMGKAKILQEFDTSAGKVAGCQITEGRIAKGDRVEFIRRDEVIAQSRIKGVREQKEEVNKVEKGRLCGVNFTSEVDFSIGDVIQSMRIV